MEHLNKKDKALQNKIIEAAKILTKEKPLQEINVEDITKKV